MIKSLMVVCSVLTFSSAFATDLNGDQEAKFETQHQAWIQKLESHPDHPLLQKAMKSNAFKKNQTKLHCWVEGAEGFVGFQQGVCRGGGRKFALSVLTIGMSAGVNFSRLTLESTQPFASHETLSGSRGGAYTGFGGEAYDLTVKGSTSEVTGTGWGVGAEVALEYSHMTLDEI